MPGMAPAAPGNSLSGMPSAGFKKGGAVKRKGKK